jgi:hypothetical protein
MQDAGGREKAFIVLTLLPVSGILHPFHFTSAS